MHSVAACACGKLGAGLASRGGTRSLVAHGGHPRLIASDSSHETARFACRERRAQSHIIDVVGVTHFHRMPPSLDNYSLCRVRRIVVITTIVKRCDGASRLLLTPSSFRFLLFRLCLGALVLVRDDFARHRIDVHFLDARLAGDLDVVRVDQLSVLTFELV